MQKINKKASILIWSIILSLIITISFLTISTQITKNIKNKNKLNTELELNQNIENILTSTNNDKELLGNSIIQIENKTLIKTLKKYEKFEILFPKNSNITLTLLNSGIIFYKTGSNNNHKLYNGNKEIRTNISQANILKLENYSGYTTFKLQSNNKFEINKKRYKIIEKIGNKKIIKSSGYLKQ